jgi:hypothetical protein
MHWVHGNGVVHRDLKPENIFLIRDGGNPHFVKVLDLGVAQMSAELASGPRTQTGTVIGTPLYMSPEALRGQRVTRAADVFAVGVIAYEMATGGWHPWQRGESRAEYCELAPAELCHRQLTSPPVDPRLRCAGIRAELAEVILALLDADPAKRPDDRAAALQLAKAAPADGLNPDGIAVLREVAPDLMKSDNLLETIPAVAPPSTLASAATRPGTVAWSRLRWGVLAGLGSFLLTVLIADAFIAGRGGSREPTVAPAPAIDTRPIAADGAIAPTPVRDGGPDAEGVVHAAADAAAPLDADVLAPRSATPPVPPAGQGQGQAKASWWCSRSHGRRSGSMESRSERPRIGSRSPPAGTA